MTYHDDPIGKPMTAEQRAAAREFHKDVLQPLFDDPDSGCSNTSFRFLVWHEDDIFSGRANCGTCGVSWPIEAPELCCTCAGGDWYPDDPRAPYTLHYRRHLDKETEGGFLDLCEAIGFAEAAEDLGEIYAVAILDCYGRTAVRWVCEPTDHRMIFEVYG